MNDKDRVYFKALLTEARKSLSALIDSTAQSRAPVELDQTVQGRLSRQDALMQQEMARENHRRRLDGLKRIDWALRRMDSEDYGYCVKCDEPIARKRLELDPATATCVGCAGGGC
jgi:DnaK suppressor protein